MSSGRARPSSGSRSRSRRNLSIGSAAARNRGADFITSSRTGVAEVGGTKGNGGDLRFYILPYQENTVWFYDSWTGKTLLRFTDGKTRQMIDVLYFHETKMSIRGDGYEWSKKYFKPVFVRPLVVEKKDYVMTLADDNDSYSYGQYIIPHFDVKERRDFLEYFDLDFNQQF